MRTKVTVENGKAEMELDLRDLRESVEGRADRPEVFCVYLWDGQGQQVFYCEHPVKEDEECVIRLVHPHLWEGVSCPYLYHLEIYGRGEKGSDLLESCTVPLRQMTALSETAHVLNGRPFTPRAVIYDNLCAGPAAGSYCFWIQVENRLEQLVRMGANMIAFRDFSGTMEEKKRFCGLCDRLGLLSTVRGKAGFPEDGVEGGALFDGGGFPTAAYYFQKAQWGREPFVYLHSGSLKRQPDGYCEVKVYSNAGRVALLVDGRVFGFQEDGPEFVFRDIPVKRRPFTLTAEAGERSMSVACY